MLDSTCMWTGGAEAEITLECGGVPLVLNRVSRVDFVMGVQIVTVLRLHYFPGLASAAISLHK